MYTPCKWASYPAPSLTGKLALKELALGKTGDGYISTRSILEVGTLLDGLQVHVEDKHACRRATRRVVAICKLCWDPEASCLALNLFHQCKRVRISACLAKSTTVLFSDGLLTMSCRPSVHPGITRLSGNVVGSPRGIEESNSWPSVVQPV